jgi:hypothetical protein
MNFYLKVQILWDFSFNSKYLCVKSLKPNNSEIHTMTSGFFHESVSPKSSSIPLGPFQNFLEIHGDIHSSRFTTGVVDTGSAP